MTQEMRAAGALGGVFVALLAIGLPLMILLALDPASQAACGGTPTGPGPSSVPGIRATCCRSSRAPPSSSPSAATAGRTSPRSTTPSRPSPPTTDRGPACCQAPTQPARPVRCRSGSAGRRPTTGTPWWARSRRTCPAACSRRASTTRSTPSTAPPLCCAIGGRPATGRPRSWRGTTTRRRSRR